MGGHKKYINFYPRVKRFFFARWDSYINNQMVKNRTFKNLIFVLCLPRKTHSFGSSKGLTFAKMTARTVFCQSTLQAKEIEI